MARLAMGASNGQSVHSKQLNPISLPAINSITHPHKNYLFLIKPFLANQFQVYFGFTPLIAGANKGWALGSERFKQEAETLLTMRLTPKQRGGDRRSKQYKQNNKGGK